MSKLVRPAEAGWIAVVEMQKDNVESKIARGIKRLITTAGSIPPSDNSPSNLNNMVKMKKLFEMFKFNNTNKINDFMPNINRQNLTKILKYFA